MKNITIDELLKIHPKNIIDISNKEKYNDNHITNAYNIPFDKLLLNPSNYIEKDEIYYVYCQSGIRSKKICTILNSKGYNLINIIGGYEAWILTQ